jgi:uncharacterized protein (DUF2235 family)
VSKNIVICLDGTGNQLKAQGNTNVVELYDLLDLSDPARQVAYYDPGVGTFSAPGAWTPFARWFSRMTGLAFGVGMRQNLGEAYTYLMRTYEPGDRIYLFGFSRGAYTARALSGLLYTVGIFRPGAENLVQYAVTSYTRRTKDWVQLDKFRWIFGHRVDGETRVPVEYLGVWDTVKAAGLLRWDAKWPFTRNLVNIRKVRHAVSIDEYRRPYVDYLAGVYDTHGKGLEPDVYEVWFAGVHSDVGGTFADDAAHHPLCKITLKWILQGAVAAGVLVKQGPYHAMCANVTADNARGTVHRMGKAWRLLGYRKRVLPENVRVRVHESVRERMAAADLKYAPKIPADAHFVDEHWARR